MQLNWVIHHQGSVLEYLKCKSVLITGWSTFGRNNLHQAVPVALS